MTAPLVQATQQLLDELVGTPKRRPYVGGMTTERWRDVPVMVVPVRACLPTQRVLAKWVNEYIEDGRRPSYSGDRFGNIIVYKGRWMITDGHHRWAAAIVEGRPYWAARVLVA